jgi:hypothetical protein
MSTFNMDPLSQLADQERRKANARAASSPGTQLGSPAAQAELRFVPSGDRRRANLQSFVEKTRAVDPAGAEQLRSIFASDDMIERMGQEMAKFGLRTDDLADAYTLWWISCWSAVHGDFSTPDRATVDAVKSQATRALLAGGRTNATSDAVKQEFAEALLIQALLLDTSLQQAKGNGSQLKLLAAAANQGAKGMGLDLTKMMLTPSGFEIKR